MKKWPMMRTIHTVSIDNLKQGFKNQALQMTVEMKDHCFFWQYCQKITQYDNFQTYVNGDVLWKQLSSMGPVIQTTSRWWSGITVGNSTKLYLIRIWGKNSCGHPPHPIPEGAMSSVCLSSSCSTKILKMLPNLCHPHSINYRSLLMSYHQLIQVQTSQWRKDPCEIHSLTG